MRGPSVCLVVWLTVAAATLVSVPAASAGTAPGPDATTAAATDVTGTSATFAATINPRGLATKVHFDYGTTTEYGLRTPDVDVGDALSTIPFTAPVTGLRRGTRYYYRAYAVSSGGFEAGDPLDFLTLALIPPVGRPNVTAGPATDVTQTSMTLHATVETHGGPTTVNVTYGPSRPVGASTEEVTLQADGPVSFPLTGLTPGARFAYRFNAKNSVGTAVATGFGQTLSLTALPKLQASPATVIYGSVTTITGQMLGRPGVTVTLQRQPFPYVGPFAPYSSTATAVTDGAGIFTFRPLVSIGARFAVTADGFALPSVANAAEVHVAPDVRPSVQRAGRGRFRVSGTYHPDVAASVVLIRVGHGRSGNPVKARAKGRGMTFQFRARRLLPGKYQVRVLIPKFPALGYVSGQSDTFRIPRSR